MSKKNKKSNTSNKKNNQITNNKENNSTINKDNNNLNKEPTSSIDKETNTTKESETIDSTTSTEVKDIDTHKPTINDFMGNGNDVFTTYKSKYENTMSSAIILLFFGILGILSTVGMLTGFINLNLSAFQHIFLTTLYLIFFAYGIVSFLKALDYKEMISTENTMEDTIDRYLENHITKEYLDSIHDNSMSEEENYVLYIEKIQAMFLNENPDFDKELVEYHIDNFLNENF
ncbi:MAG: hypothetical protein E7262_07705 [Lachnospiraceae bacterium]|nr:hypothetical protein [Lachnospiraceae bacterium]